jgi:hypothetical protein
MSAYLDRKYLDMISSSFDGYTVKREGNFLAACRCFLCGDSQKSKIKKRGFFFQKGDGILYTCFNCGCGLKNGSCLSIKSILKDRFFHLYQEYMVEQFASNKPVVIKEKQIPFEFIPPFLENNKPLNQLRKISTLDDEHPAKSYLLSRKIPKDKFNEIYYCEHFPAWVNSMVPHKLDEKYDEARIVIPYTNRTGTMTGFQARSMAKNPSKRYITIMLVEGAVKAYNYYGVDFDRENFTVEGQFDSMFLPNCMAMGSADVDKALLNMNTSVIIYDNEKRSEQITKKIRQTIELGFKVVIWPSNLKEKDINEMVLAGHNVKSIIRKNTFQNQSALLAFNNWTRS